MLHSEARAMALQEMDKWSLLEQGWKFSFNRRMKRTLGRCNHAKKLIELGHDYVADNGLPAVLDTIRHEIAHAKAGPHHGHDSVWKEWCGLIGAKPNQYASTKDKVVDFPWRLAIRHADGTLEPLNHFGFRRTNMARKQVRGRPETPGRLVWVKNENN
ncbi:MAG: SprT-like domain-containing protein [Pseudomonadales bacterium]|nr:SprT-like domain-containing protein [Pseudomonadales bacterium]